ncbi:MAG: hypothetical protein FWC38_00525 [Proteobacteria bacterium]|nr:hypothetical protein [Pseudomonadota bacterium]
MRTILILLLALTLSGCATLQRPGCLDTIPASALYGCAIEHLRTQLPEDARVSDLIAADLDLIEALKHCREDYLSLVHHILIACPK